PASAGATGVAFTNIAFGLALMKAPDGSSYYALQASGSGQLVGLDQSAGVTLNVQNMMIQANGGSTADVPSRPAAVNFGATFGSNGLSVPTGGTPIVLGGAADTAGNFNHKFLSASGSVTLQIGTNVYVSGNMAFSESTAVTATLSDGSTKSLSVLTVGASDVSAFFGINGPATNSNAVGLSITHLTFGLA